MHYLHCEQCGARFSGGISLQPKGRYRPRCAAALVEKKRAEESRTTFLTFIILLAAIQLMVGVLVWFLFFAN
jgi:uncharacterized paraquat-inducible protein A